MSSRLHRQLFYVGHLMHTLRCICGSLPSFSRRKPLILLFKLIWSRCFRGVPKCHCRNHSALVQFSPCRLSTSSGSLILFALLFVQLRTKLSKQFFLNRLNSCRLRSRGFFLQLKALSHFKQPSWYNQACLQTFQFVLWSLPCRWVRLCLPF